MSMFSNVKLLSGQLDGVSSLGTFGTKTHAGLLDIANSTYGGAILGSAAAGATINGINGGLNDRGFFGSAFSGAVTGGLIGAGTRGAAGAYAKNAVIRGADGFAELVGGKYKVSIGNTPVTDAKFNAFKWSNFTSAD